MALVYPEEQKGIALEPCVGFGAGELKWEVEEPAIATKVIEVEFKRSWSVKRSVEGVFKRIYRYETP